MQAIKSEIKKNKVKRTFSIREDFDERLIERYEKVGISKSRQVEEAFKLYFAKLDEKGKKNKEEE